MEKFQKYIIATFLVIVASLVAFLYFQHRNYTSEIEMLHNQVASYSTTTSTPDGSLTRLAMEIKDLKATNQGMQSTIDSQKQKTVEAEKVAIAWKAKYEVASRVIPSVTTSTIVWLPSPTSTQVTCDKERKEYLTSVDFGFVAAGCRIFSSDSAMQTRVTLDPGSKPLSLNLALSRDKNKQWHSYVKLDPPNDKSITMDISSIAVNMEPLDRNWYERLSVGLDVGLGNSGALLGLGVGVDIGQFNVGPRFWGITSSGGTVMYGMGLTWNPFKN